MSMAKSVAGKNIKPLSDFILIKPTTQEEVLPSGIVLPDTVKEKPQIGEVMAVGPGKINEQGKVMPVQVKAGQKVLYKKWGGNEIKVGSEEWMLIEQADVMAIVS